MIRLYFVGFSFIVTFRHNRSKYKYLTLKKLDKPTLAEFRKRLKVINVREEYK